MGNTYQPAGILVYRCVIYLISSLCSVGDQSPYLKGDIAWHNEIMSCMEEQAEEGDNSPIILLLSKQAIPVSFTAHFYPVLLLGLS